MKTYYLSFLIIVIHFCLFVYKVEGGISSPKCSVDDNIFTTDENARLTNVGTTKTKNSNFKEKMKHCLPTNHERIVGIWEANSCEDFLLTKRTDNSSIWVKLQENYEEVVVYSTIEDKSRKFNGFEIKYSVENIEGKGKGLVAREDIIKGQIIYVHKHCGYFLSVESFIEFLNRIPDNLVCNAVIWGYVNTNSDNILDWVSYTDGGWMMIDFDDMSYCNDGDGKANVDYRRDDKSQNLIYSLLDIAAGEEILCDYVDYGGTFEMVIEDANKLMQTAKKEILKAEATIQSSLQEYGCIVSKDTSFFYEHCTKILHEIYSSAKESIIGNPYAAVNGFNIKYTVNAVETILIGQIICDHNSEGSFPDIKSYSNFINRVPEKNVCDKVKFGFSFDVVSKLNGRKSMETLWTGEKDFYF